MENEESKNKEMTVDEILLKFATAVGDNNDKKISELETKLAESQKRVEELTILVDTLNKRVPELQSETDAEKNKQEVIDFIKKL